MVDYCVICGAYVPEGRQVCGLCERRVEGGKTMDGSGDQLSDTTLSRDERAGFSKIVR
jgi:hypothetical protein